MSLPQFGPGTWQRPTSSLNPLEGPVIVTELLEGVLTYFATAALTFVTTSGA
jgi:hypothetical protein